MTDAPKNNSLAQAFSRWIHRKTKKLRLINADPRKIFTDFYLSNAWGEKDSLSGSGSTMEQTRVVTERLPHVISDFKIATMLDIPCGDFHWMSRVDLKGCKYTGADIVQEAVEQNRKNFSRPNVDFRQLNLIADPLPKVDLIFCRDCLVHLSHADVLKALKNIRRSGSTFLLATTFTDVRTNKSILTGQWRPINLQIAPFHLPAPLLLINEESGEDGGKFKDKSLGLWRIDQILGS